MDPVSDMNCAKSSTGRGFTPALRVAGLTVCIALASLGIVFALPSGTSIERGHLGMMSALAVAFMLSERLIFHIEARHEAISYTPSEIGLAIGVVFVFPLELVIARLIGAFLGMIIWRRPPAMKLIFNLAHFALETLVAVAVFRAISSFHGGVAMTWVALLIGINVALVAGGILVAVAISQFEGRLYWRIRNELISAPVFHLPPAVLATLIAVCATIDPWLGLFALTPAPLVWFMIRSHGALMHRHRDLTSVHDFSRIVGDATDLRDVATAAAERLANSSRAERVTLRLWTNDGTPIDAVIGRPIDRQHLPDTPTDPGWMQLLESRHAWRFGAGDPSSPAGITLGEAGIEHCLIGAVADEHGPVGVAILSDRQGMSAVFDEDDRSRLTSMVQQLAIVVRKAQFHSQIQYEAAHDRLTIAPIHGRGAAVLLRHADIAMYDAKTRRIRSSVYCDDIEETDSTRLTMLADLRTALKDKAITVEYQPQIDVATGRVIGAEALARWNHPEHGQVDPTVFVGLAEQAGLIEALTQQVLSFATASAVEWQRRGWDLAVSVNISAQSLLDEGLESLVATALAKSGLAPDRLTLEITETTMMGEATRTHRILQGLADLGIRLSVDDFGTGYSSLVNLRHFPISELKIDRRFVFGLMKDQNDDIIVRSTIDLGQNLGLTVVAEGVENADVHARLVELGCDGAQGYGISRPLSSQAFLFWISDRHKSVLLKSEPLEQVKCSVELLHHVEV